MKPLASTVVGSMLIIEESGGPLFTDPEDGTGTQQTAGQSV